MKKDPVCNMDVDERDAVTTECDGVVHYFCSQGCREKFLKERECKVPRTSYDLIIIGGGPAGLTAAVYAATLKMNALLITKDLGGQAIDSTKVENYMGFDFITGPELVEKFQQQLVRSHYIDHLMSEVEKIAPSDECFHVTTSELKTYSANALLIATGMTRRKLNVPGEEALQRRGVFYGNIQDFSFVQGEPVSVLGGGNSALQMVENLANVAGDIYLVSDMKLTADPVIVERVKRIPHLEIYEDFKVEEFSGQGSLSGITIREKGTDEPKTVPVKGAFIAIGFQPNVSLVSQLVNLNEKGEVMVDPDCSTSYPGIFAAGDLTNAFGKRIIIACGEGAKAALAARQYILTLKRR
ncbi:MAG: FAD-dependent oxidoreductase [Nitrospirae bacterium]|nr:FAD-dependent oxidoreductase [Nitrospirota bacterium]